MIRLHKDLYIADPWPAAFIKSRGILIIADLHLGIEGVLEEDGLYLPRRASELTEETVFNMLDDISPDTLIIAGDLKHSFGLLNASEWIEIKKFLRTLKEDYKQDIRVIRGNHDNYLGVVLDKFNIPFNDKIEFDEYSILHGHTDVDIRSLRNVVIMGHEHPSISIRDELGVKYKFKCFLWGDFGDKKILVLPSLSELATGSSYTDYEYVEPLSPILKKVDLGNLKPYPIVVGQLVRELPRLRELKKLI